MLEVLLLWVLGVGVLLGCCQWGCWRWRWGCYQIHGAVGAGSTVTALSVPGLLVPVPGLLVPVMGLLVPVLGLLVPVPGVLVPVLMLLVLVPGVLVPVPGRAISAATRGHLSAPRSPLPPQPRAGGPTGTALTHLEMGPGPGAARSLQDLGGTGPVREQGL